MPHLIVALSISLFAMALTWSYLKPARMPLLIYFLAYTTTTVVGAAGLLDDIGMRQFQIHQPMFHPEDYPLVGSTTYWLLLLAPFFLVPIGAAAGLRMANIKLAERSAAFVTGHEPSVRLIFYSIVCACAVYCLWKLVSTGAYFPDLFFDRSLYCDARVMRRAELFGELRYLYYAFVYAVIPIGATVALLSWKDTSRHFHAGMFFLLFAATLYFNVVLYMKANLVVFFLTLLFGCIVAKAPLRFLIALSAAAVACLLLLQGLLGCYRNSFPDPAFIQSLSVQQQGEPSDDARTSAPDVPPVQQQMTRGQVFVDAAVVFARSAVFRTAASVPYYAQIFGDPGERCGIESNFLPFLPRETCYPATKVGTHVNPGTIQAFQSAPAHIHAYAELGPGYACVVLLVAGAILGFCWSVSQKAKSPLFWSAGAAVCTFAYYLTQASLVGALTHSYGFVWYLFPIVTAVLIHAFAWIAISHLPARMKAGVK